MANLIQLTSSKTYKTEAAAIKAVQDKYERASFRFMVVCTPQGRYYPVCIGMDAVRESTQFNFVTIA